MIFILINLCLFIFLKVKHAFGKKDNICVALKISNTANNRQQFVDREIDVLIYFNSVPEDQRTHIIKMSGR